MWTSAIRLAQSGADPEQFGENTAVISQSLNLAKCQECLNMICGKLWHWKAFFFFKTSKYAQLLDLWLAFTHLFSSAYLGPGHGCQQPKHTSPDLPLPSHLLFEGSIPRPAKARHTKAWYILPRRPPGQISKRCLTLDCNCSSESWTLPPDEDSRTASSTKKAEMRVWGYQSKSRLHLGSV